MKILQSLSCLITDSTAKETVSGGIFDEIKGCNINPNVLSGVISVECFGEVYLLDEPSSHRRILANIKSINAERLFNKDEALMLINKASVPFLDIENREIMVYLQDTRYYLIAESFTRREGGQVRLIKRVLLCKINLGYCHASGTRIILR